MGICTVLPRRVRRLFSAALGGLPASGDQEDPLVERIEALQSIGGKTSARAARKKGKGFLNGFRYRVGLHPGRR